QIDAVVGDAALRKIVRTDAFAAIAAADQALARRGLFLRALLPLAIEQPRCQHRHRLRAIAVLRAIVLAFDDEPRGQVRDAHRRVGLVDVLAAGARRPKRVDADLGGIDGDVGDRIGFGQYRDSARGRVDAPLRLRGGHALDTVSAGFELELRVHILAGDARDHFLVPAHVALPSEIDFDLPFVAFAKRHV